MKTTILAVLALTITAGAAAANPAKSETTFTPANKAKIAVPYDKIRICNHPGWVPTPQGLNRAALGPCMPGQLAVETPFDH
jgi:hypothetical protein